MVKFAVICASNQNRSMEAHKVLFEAGFDVSSFGTGTAVRLPGRTASEPNIYEFGKPYEEILKELVSQNRELYRKNGLIHMLERNKRLKVAPERFQMNQTPFDVLFTCEERCFDSVLQELLQRGGNENLPVHVINVEIIDNHQSATEGAKLILELATHIRKAGNDRNARMSDILGDFEKKHGDILLHTITYY